MDVRVCSPVGDIWKRTVTVGGGGGGERKFSHESEHDLAVMVSDFLESNGSIDADSWCSSDSESGFPDLHHLADKISFLKWSMDQYEIDLQSVVQSVLLSMGGSGTDIQLDKSGLCNGSCIRYAVVKLLRSSGYDAGVCASKWQGFNKVPGGDHEYIDVVIYLNDGKPERLIIDIDFRSHFEIARAVQTYDKILKTLPVAFVGSFVKLKNVLKVMAEAAKLSLKQNSMPLPPWRSLDYLQAKWHSPYQRSVITPDDQNTSSSKVTGHDQCNDHLRQLQSSLQSEIGTERLVKPMKISNTSRRLKLEKRKTSFRNL